MMTANPILFELIVTRQGKRAKLTRNLAELPSTIELAVRTGHKLESLVQVDGQESDSLIDTIWALRPVED